MWQLGGIWQLGRLLLVSRAGEIFPTSEKSAPLACLECCGFESAAPVAICSRSQPENRVDLANRAAQNLLVMKKATKRRQKLALPSPGELRLLQSLWRIGGGTIEDIVKSSRENPPPNYKTVQTLLRIMERKGQIDHSQDGRAFVFRALVGPGDLRRLSIRELATKYFTGSTTELVVELLRDERISQEELRELENLIRSRRKELL